MVAPRVRCADGDRMILHSGALQVMACCDLFSEGFDLPGIHVGILLRPTATFGLYLQQVGRCLRIAPGNSEAMIFDHAGNSTRFGLPTDERDWHSPTMRPNAKQNRGFGSRLPAARLRRPRAYPLFQLRFWVSGRPRQIDERDGELTEITPEMVAKGRDGGRGPGEVAGRTAGVRAHEGEFRRTGLIMFGMLGRGSAHGEADVARAILIGTSHGEQRLWRNSCRECCKTAAAIASATGLPVGSPDPPPVQCVTIGPEHVGSGSLAVFVGIEVKDERGKNYLRASPCSSTCCARSTPIMASRAPSMMPAAYSRSRPTMPSPWPTPPLSLLRPSLAPRKLLPR